MYKSAQADMWKAPKPYSSTKWVNATSFVTNLILCDLRNIALSFMAEITSGIKIELRLVEFYYTLKI